MSSALCYQPVVEREEDEREVFVTEVSPQQDNTGPKIAQLKYELDSDREASCSQRSSLIENELLHLGQASTAT